MVRLPPTPDRDFVSEDDKREPEIDWLMSEPPLPWDEMLDDVIRARVGKLIATAARRSNKQDPH